MSKIATLTDRATKPHRYCIGIGVQKSATSWLHAVLATHPQIAASSQKEIDYFSARFDRGHRWYGTHFPTGGSWRFEVSPSYFHDPRAAERLVEFAPDARIIALLRDPVTRAWSNHLHEVGKGHIPAIPFAEGLSNNPSYVQQGLYHTHLSRWYRAFPKRQILILLAEDIAANPTAVAGQVYEFLRIDGAHRSGLLTERRNESDRAKNPLLRRFLRAGGDTMRRAGMEEALMRLKRTTPVAGLLQWNRHSIAQDIPAMTEADRDYLIRQFTPEVERLAQLLDRPDLPWPNFAARQAGDSIGQVATRG